jgi:nitronate monooxygenase
VDLSRLGVPIVQAPLAGGPSTPALAAAVASAGGLGFLAAGYKTADAVAADMRELRSLNDQPFGVNVFAAPGLPGDVDALERYAAELRAEADRYGAELGDPRHDDDQLEAKLKLMRTDPPAVVSFTFGCPDAHLVTALKAAGADVWVTVTNPDEAALAAGAGADALVVQGFEGGGHRGYFVDDPGVEDLGLLALLRLVADRVPLPLIAAGGIADGAALAAVLAAGAVAAQLGSALMLAPEAGTAAAYRAALGQRGKTALTRAFSGRPARSIVNRFMDEHEAGAPHAYPDVHHITSPIRAAARAAGDAEAVNLWAGQAHALALELPAAEIVARIAADARESAAAAVRRLGEASRP